MFFIGFCGCAHLSVTRETFSVWIFSSRLVSKCLLLCRCLPVDQALELETKVKRRFTKISQSRRRPLLGPSPGWKRLLALLHFWTFVSSSTGCPVKLFRLCYLLFCWLLLVQIAKVGTFFLNSGNLLHDRHQNFENRF